MRALSSLISRNLFRFHVLPFMDHGQHLDEGIGFDLVQNPVGIQPQLAHRVFIQFRYFVPVLRNNRILP